MGSGRDAGQRMTAQSGRYPPADSCDRDISKHGGTDPLLGGSSLLRHTLVAADGHMLRLGGSEGTGDTIRSPSENFTLVVFPLGR